MERTVKMERGKPCVLQLSDGSLWQGTAFGAEVPVEGEVVFNTAMTGYVESLTDPSYAGQLMVLTYPLVGNYGVPPCGADAYGLPLRWESTKIQAEALIVEDYSAAYSHHLADMSLDEWMRRQGIPGITGIDTRALTRRLREGGVTMGRIRYEDSAADAIHTDYGSQNSVSRVSCTEVIRYNEGAGLRVLLPDYGVKANILRCLLQRGVEVIRTPWDYDFNTLPFDGLFLSNGPGNPDTCGQAVQHIRRFMDTRRSPLMGICLGNQLLAKAAGASVYKLKYGHRSHNQPVRECGTDRCYITSQNHGYAVDDTNLPEGWQTWFQNLNDGSNEGIRHQELPWYSVQFHPEACGGPTDTLGLFDRFIGDLKQR